MSDLTRETTNLFNELTSKKIRKKTNSCVGCICDTLSKAKTKEKFILILKGTSVPLSLNEEDELTGGTILTLEKFKHEDGCAVFTFHQSSDKTKYPHLVQKKFIIDCHCICGLVFVERDK
ncbi:hypothetical protein [Terrilactibacillus laevilacticus]|uniref:Uncharacterized protein n=1 Tax=Terrilactibacillus laevilacticus TaxID=1380157 RepID=A0ABW5PMY2_9BACI|nr:hypothetical protein [Terrilactibacillus laevilacticus]